MSRRRPESAPATTAETAPTGTGLPAETGLVRAARYLQPGRPSADGREIHRQGGRRAEEFYRERRRHDKVVRSIHGVNCTGSCWWQV